MGSYNITKESAVSVAKWHVAQLPTNGLMAEVGKKAALNGGIEKIFDEVYALGFTVSAKDNNPTHQRWLSEGRIVKEG